MIPDIAYGLVWLWLFNPIYGPINVLLGWRGAARRRRRGASAAAVADAPERRARRDHHHEPFTIGEGFVILLVTRQGLPAELYELAALEDATAWGVFRRITLPLMAPILSCCSRGTRSSACSATFVPALVVTEGGPPVSRRRTCRSSSTGTPSSILRYGYAAAATLLMFALTALIVWLQWRIVRRWRKGFVV